MTHGGIYEYGSRAGVWRILREFEKRGLPLTVFGVGMALRAPPRAARPPSWSCGHEIACHGWRWIHYQNLDEATEREHMRLGMEAIEKLTGERAARLVHRPRQPATRAAWSPTTAASSTTATTTATTCRSGCRCRRPTATSVPHLVVPYTLDANDMRFALPQGFSHGDHFFQYLRDSFDVLYAEGDEAPEDDEHRHALPPARPARPHRARCSASSTTSQQHDRVWVCRRIDIARHWKATHPFDAATAWSLTCALHPRPTQRRHRRRSSRRCSTASTSTRRGSPKRALAQRPFRSLAHLKHALVAGRAPRPAATRSSALIRAHPELAGKAMVSKTLTAESTNEQGKAGLTDCTPEEFAKIQQLNADYNAKFGFPFILAVRGPRGTGLSQARDHRHLRAPAGQPSRLRARRGLRNIHRIAEIRLNDKFGVEPTLGNHVWDWPEQLAAHSDPGYAEKGQLTVTYLTDAHRACAAQIARLDARVRLRHGARSTRSATSSAVYHGSDARRARRLLTGSHYDTVRNGGKYDGRLGIFVPMACVRELHSARAGACPSASRWSASPRRKASATRRPSSARAR